MQFTNIVTAMLALALTAAGAPAAADGAAAMVAARNDGTGSCNANQEAACCNDILGILTCTIVEILATGDTCGDSGNSYCCQTNAAIVSFQKYSLPRWLMTLTSSRLVSQGQQLVGLNCIEVNL